MEKALFWRFVNAVYAVLYEKKQISEAEFRHFTVPLREKTREKTDDGM